MWQIQFLVFLPLLWLIESRRITVQDLNRDTGRIHFAVRRIDLCKFNYRDPWNTPIMVMNWIHPHHINDLDSNKKCKINFKVTHQNFLRTNIRQKYFMIISWLIHEIFFMKTHLWNTFYPLLKLLYIHLTVTLWFCNKDRRVKFKVINNLSNSKQNCGTFTPKCT